MMGYPSVPIPIDVNWPTLVPVPSSITGASLVEQSTAVQCTTLKSKLLSSGPCYHSVKWIGSGDRPAGRPRLHIASYVRDVRPAGLPMASSLVELMHGFWEQHGVITTD